MYHVPCRNLLSNCYGFIPCCSWNAKILKFIFLDLKFFKFIQQRDIFQKLKQTLINSSFDQVQLELQWRPSEASAELAWVRSHILQRGEFEVLHETDEEDEELCPG